MSPELTDALTAVASACVVPVALMGTGALYKAAAWLGYHATAQDRANMEGEITAALNVGIKTGMPILRLRGWNSPEAHAAILSAATAYFQQRFPARCEVITEAAKGDDGKAVPPHFAVGETLAGRLASALYTAGAPNPDVPPQPSPSVVEVGQVPNGDTPTGAVEASLEQLRPGGL